MKGGRLGVRQPVLLEAQCSSGDACSRLGSPEVVWSEARNANQRADLPLTPICVCSPEFRACSGWPWVRPFGP